MISRLEISIPIYKRIKYIRVCLWIYVWPLLSHMLMKRPWVHSLSQYKAMLSRLEISIPIYKRIKYIRVCLWIYLWPLLSQMLMKLKIAIPLPASREGTLGSQFEYKALLSRLKLIECFRVIHSCIQFNQICYENYHI